MDSENIKDHEVLDLLDLSDSEVDEWIPDSDEEWAVTDEEDDPEPNHQERRCSVFGATCSPFSRDHTFMNFSVALNIYASFNLRCNSYYLFKFCSRVNSDCRILLRQV
ncbi:hypothetical protein PoB_005817200 [Plakobranchus ocellatus]|uniref:Uncharacterized protein n=1 Tax=Plakobranchus ocellatus TaxID=259542 RepID=A0AAV4CJT5_9GAST|nr:hypothetical protein PoB_005817200 [Plakobranchus ocellatus]